VERADADEVRDPQAGVAEPARTVLEPGRLELRE
jgi:hypothetical protein